MKRDFDLIRLILIDIEEKSVPSNPQEYHFDYNDQDAVAVSLDLIFDRGLATAKSYPTYDAHPADYYFNPKLTWEGYDFLESIRDDEIWRKTKDGAAKAGGFTFDLLKALAKGLLKKKIETHTGVELDL